MVLFVLVSFISLLLGYATRPDCERNTEDYDEHEAEKHGTAPRLHLCCKFDHVTSRRVNGEYFSVFAESSPEFASIDSFSSDLFAFFYFRHVTKKSLECNTENYDEHEPEERRIASSLSIKVESRPP